MSTKFLVILNLLLTLLTASAAKVQKRFRPAPAAADFTFGAAPTATQMTFEFEDEWKLFTAGHGMPKEACNKTLCTPPCPGAAAPAKCPTRMPYCHSGCACTYHCEAGLIQCFMTSHCIDNQRKRFLTRRNQQRVTSIIED